MAAAKRRVRGRAAWIAAAVAVVLFALWAFRPSPVELETATVRRAPLEVIVEEEGMTRVPDPDVVAAPFSGELDRITLDPGDLVERGQVLARIRPVELDPSVEAQVRAEIHAAQAREQQAKTQVVEAQARLDRAAADARRARTLEQAGAISRQQLEQAEEVLTRAQQALAATRAQVDAAQAEIAAIRARLQRAGTSPGAEAQAITAPSTGRVLRVVEEGQRAVPAGTPLLEIGDLATLEVVTDVLSTDAVTIAPGDPVRVQAWGGGKTLHGTVTRVEPSARTEISALGVEEQRVDVIARLRDAPPELGHLYRVETQFVTWSEPDVLQVPLAALFRVDDGWGTWVDEEGRARLRRVRIGVRGEEAVQVLEGLAEGTEVILYPPQGVEEGVRIRSEPRQADVSPAPAPSQAPPP